MTAEIGKRTAGLSGGRKAWAVAFLVLAALLVFAVLGVVGTWFLLSHSSPINRASALKVTKEWGRLANFPAHSRIVDIDVRGNEFTRGFVVNFEASTSEIEQWVKDSAGLSDAAITIQEDGSTLYEITPGGGAQYAEVVIWASKGYVRIHVYWS